MSKSNGTMPTFTFSLEDITARDMNALVKGGDIEKMAPIIVKIVTACSEDVGDLKDPETYLNLRWKVWRALMDQLGEAVKNA